MTSPPEERAAICETCGGEFGTLPSPYFHDHKPDGSGLDDGPYLPGCVPRKKRVVDPATFSAERKRGWETRRAKYGERGHR